MATASSASNANVALPFPFHLPAHTPFRLVQGVVREECSEMEVDQLVQLHWREPLTRGNVPSWLTLLESGDAYTIPLVDGSRAVKILYLHHGDLPRLGLGHVVNLFNQICDHLCGTANASGFLEYRDELHSNRDGAGTAFTTSFARVNSFLVAPVAHSSEIDKESTAPRRAWLQRFNALVGDLSGVLYRSILASEYCDMLESWAEITNPPCPGSSFESNRFITSIQINCSHPDRQVAGTAGLTHRDRSDDPLSFSVAFNASVVRPSTRLGYFLFPGLGCAVPLQPGGITLFSGAELHRGMPIVVDPQDRSAIPLDFVRETRFQVIAYPSFPLLSARLERCMPTTQQSHDRRHPTPFDMVTHSLSAFGSADAKQRWNERESVRQLVNNLHYNHFRTDKLDLPSYYRVLFPHAPPPTYRHLHLSGCRSERDALSERVWERLKVLSRTFHSCRFRGRPEDHHARKRQRQQDVDHPAHDDAEDADDNDGEADGPIDHDVPDDSTRMRHTMGSDTITRQGAPVAQRNPPRAGTQHTGDIASLNPSSRGDHSYPPLDLDQSRLVALLETTALATSCAEVTSLV